MIYGPFFNTLSAAVGWRHCLQINSGIHLAVGLVAVLAFFRLPKGSEDSVQKVEASMSAGGTPENRGAEEQIRGGGQKEPALPARTCPEQLTVDHSQVQMEELGETHTQRTSHEEPSERLDQEI